MGIYYGVTVGYGFQVPLSKIKKLPEWKEIGYAEEVLDVHLYGNYKHLSFASAHDYDASDEETAWVIAVSRLTDSWDAKGSFGLVTLDTLDERLTDDERNELAGILAELDMDPETPLGRFVASYVS